jgi:putative ABC transport system permease protein
MSFRRIPLAWKNLTHDRRRLSVAIGGIAFAVLLMFMQTGFRYALLDSTVQVIEDLNADLILVSTAQYALPAQQRFSIQRIYQARSCSGVAGAYPLYMENFYAVLRRPERKGLPIRVLACNLDDPVFRSGAVDGYRDALRRPDTALLDVKRKDKYEIEYADEQALRQVSLKLSDRAIQLVGTFALGTDFANDGNLIMSAPNFARYFPYRASGNDPLGLVDLGLVQVSDRADVSDVQRRLQSMLPEREGLFVFTKQQFVEREMNFWSRSTPIGVIFFMGTIMGFVVGVIICYQIIYASIADHMSEFATLKAMGYPGRYFVGVVFFESLYLSVLGFVPGMLVSLVLYQGLAYSTGLLMVPQVSRTVVVYLLTLFMCTASGFLAMRKVLSADPAELF